MTRLKTGSESWDQLLCRRCAFQLGTVQKSDPGRHLRPVCRRHIRSAAIGIGHPTAWLGALAYTLQIYLDFSAYSDMAIGLGMLFGFRFLENFNRPYSAVSLTDFWRRWHISLSRWFRDYLYIPLGGNRKGALRTYVNLTLVFLLCGFWHGANWTFVVWGAYHGLFLVIERMTGLRRIPENRLSGLRRLVTLMVVLCGWVIFRSDDLGQAGLFFAVMFSLTINDMPIAIGASDGPEEHECSCSVRPRR
jgi:alginate O-acetyltransferase complex protein AlgI